MPAAHCAICINHFAIDSGTREFIIFPCGHGFCSSCVDRLFSDGRTKCPNCRKPIHKRDGHPVYLELVDSEKLVAQNVIEGLEKMDIDTPLVSIKKAGKKLEQAGEIASEDSRLQMLRAKKDWDERIVPVFTKLESQKQENDKLQRDLQKSHRDRGTLQSKLKDLDALTKEVARLKKSLVDTEANTEQAIRLAEVIKAQLERERRDREQVAASVHALESENKRLREANERHKINSRNDKEKTKKLYSKYVALKEQRRKDESQIGPDPIPDYDADFSSHESSKIHNLHPPIRSSPSRSARHPYADENEVELDCQGMPPPTFASDWQFDGSITGILKKRVPSGLAVRNHRRVANSFPIELDRKGHPMKAVHLGPRSIVHVRH